MARPRSERARRRALEAAVELIHERGVGAFTVDEVVRRSGVAKTTIYRHWESGPGLLLEAVDRSIEDEPSPDTGSLRGDLEALGARLLAIPAVQLAEQRRLFIGLLGASASDDQLARSFRQMLDSRREPMLRMVDRAKRRGEIAAGIDRQLAADLISGPFFTRFLIAGETFSPTDVEQWIDSIQRALAADP